MSRFLGMVALVVFLSACGGAFTTEEGYFPYEEIKKLPELDLRYPDSVQLGTVGGPREDHLSGVNAAKRGVRYGSQASGEEIEAWFHEQLESRGWATTKRVSHATTEERTAGWRKPGLLFRFATQRKTPDDPRLDEPEIQAAYPTIYTITIIADEPMEEGEDE